MSARPVAGGRLRRLVVAMTCGAAVALGALADAAAAPLTPRTYVGGAYTAPLERPPTAGENQSKLWYHADAWWAIMLDPDSRTARVHELMQDHTWRPTPTVLTADVADPGDAKLDGNMVHTLVREADGTVQYVRLKFDPAAREYAAAAPQRVTRRGSDSTTTIAKDSTGRLWIAFATVRKVFYSWSDDEGRTWGDLTILDETGTGGTPEAAALVTYDDRVGLLWSDQDTGSYEFASHKDGDPPTTWTREQAVAGPARSDNHISLRAVQGTPSDTVVAAVKTSLNDIKAAPDQPIVELLVRTPDGKWSQHTVATIADDLNDPVLAVEDATRTVHVLASQGGDIVYKSASVDDPRFAEGRGELFVVGTDGGLVDPTVAAHSLNHRTGVVALASDAEQRLYYHAELPVRTGPAIVDQDDTTPPSPPTDLRGRALNEDTVVLTWTAATDGDRWSPAADGVPVREYVVLRDGVEVSRVPSTSIQDRLEQPAEAAREGAPRTVRYAVQAVDMAGNLSADAAVTIELPTGERSVAPYVLGVALLGLAGAAVALVLWRRRRMRRLLEAPTAEAPVGEPLGVGGPDRR